MAQLLQSPWVSGFSTIADALVQAPGNRAKALYAQQQATNMEVDNAIAQARFDREVERDRLADQRYQQEQRVAADRWTAEQQLRLAERERAAAAERRAAGLHPGAVEKQNLDIEAGEISNEFARDNNPLVIGKNRADLDYANANNPLLLRKGKAEADLKDMEANTESARLQQSDELADAVAGQAYDGIHAKMPEWNLQDLLKTGGSGIRPPGPYMDAHRGEMDAAGDYGSTSGMDEMSRRMGVEDTLQTQADTAVLDKNFNSGDWVKKQVDAGIAAEPEVVADPTNQYGDTDKGRAIGTAVRLRDKMRNNIPLTPQENDELDIAMSILSPTEVSTIMSQDGDPITTTTNVDIFGEQDGAGISQTQPPVSSGGVQTQAQQPVQTQVQPQTQGFVSPQPGAAPVRTQQVGNVSVTTAGSKGRKPPTEREANAGVYTSMAETAWNQLAPTLGYDRATGVYAPENAKVSGWDVPRVMADDALNFVTGGNTHGLLQSDESQQYQDASEAMVEPIVRFKSGAATPPAEYETGRRMYVPSVTGNEQANLNAILRTEAALKAMRAIYERTGIDPAKYPDAPEIADLRAHGEIDRIIAEEEAKLGVQTEGQPSMPQFDPAAVAELSANPTPEMRRHFDDAYGFPGASDMALGGGYGR